MWIPIQHLLAVPRQTKQRTGIGGRRTLVIYALVDPYDDCVRYIGVTSRTLAQRLALHLQKPTNAGMGEWLRGLMATGERPKIVKLEWVSRNEWEDAERGWIYWCRERGQLLNIDRGGLARTATGAVRPFKAGEFKPATGCAKLSKAGPKGSRGGATDQGSRPKCRPRLVPVTAGVFRRAQ